MGHSGTGRRRCHHPQFSTAPIFTFFLTLAVTRHEAVTSRKLLGVVAGMAGICLIVGMQALAGLGEQFAAQIAMLFAAICYAGAAIFGRSFKDLDPMAPAAGSAAVRRRDPDTGEPGAGAAVDAGAVDELTARTARARGVSTAFAFVIYFRLIQTLGSIGATAQAYLRVPIGVAAGVVFLGEKPSRRRGSGSPASSSASPRGTIRAKGKAGRRGRMTCGSPSRFRPGYPVPMVFTARPSISPDSAFWARPVECRIRGQPRPDSAMPGAIPGRRSRALCPVIRCFQHVPGPKYIVYCAPTGARPNQHDRRNDAEFAAAIVLAFDRPTDIRQFFMLVLAVIIITSTASVIAIRHIDFDLCRVAAAAGLFGDLAEDIDRRMNELRLAARDFVNSHPARSRSRSAKPRPRSATS